MKRLADRIISITAMEKIQQICLPLKRIGIHHFDHDITFGNKHISILTNTKEVFQAYFKQGLPIMCSDDSGRILEEGIYLSKFLMKSYRDCNHMIPILAKKYNLINSIHFAEKEEDCQHLFTFASDLEENDFLQIIINNLDKLKYFIKRYKKLAHDILVEAKKSKNRIILPYFNEDKPIDNYNTIIDEEQKSSNKHQVLRHKKTQTPIFLSSQQSKCFKLLLQGYSAKEIAQTMELSYRTVENYRERIREILGCQNTKEMIARYSNCINKE